MRISYNWLKQYIDLKLTPEELEDRLTFAGIEVEAVEKSGSLQKQIKIAEVVSCDPMPDSDHLSICQVNDGTETVQVVCGAPNVRAGLKIAFAPVGTVLGEFKIKKAKLRGHQSFGMICSEKELELSDNHDGIIELPEDAPLGTDLASYYELDDTIYEVEITPNRPDLLGMVGVARDLSALLNLPLRTVTPNLKEGEEKISDLLKLRIEQNDKCSRYKARVVKGVKVQESPDWLQRYLIGVGLRPINTIVDITNFVMMEWGHPIHGFDYDLLTNKEIIVRDAVDGEKLEALNGETYELTSDDLVIADGEAPIALAGIIGGDPKSINENTVNVVIEAACFEYPTVRKSSYKHKVFTDSSYRFERGMSPETCDIICDRACDLILMMSGGTIVKGCLDESTAKLEANVVGIRPERMKKVLTINIDNSTIIAYLQNLGLKFKENKDDTLYFEVPSYRNDLTREIDLIEEIIRLHGYNNVDQRIKPQRIMNFPLFTAKRKLQDVLINNGFYDTITLSFANPEDYDKLKFTEDDYLRKAVKLINPQGTDTSILRTNLITDQIKVATYNMNRGSQDLKTFEINKVYHNVDAEYTENYQLAGLMTGVRAGQYWQDKAEVIDFYDVKGIAEELLDAMKVSKARFQVCENPYLVTNMSLRVEVKGKEIGYFGKLNPEVAENFGINILDFKQDIFVFDFNLTAMLGIASTSPREFVEPSKFPLIRRDLSFQASVDVTIEKIAKAIKSVNPSIIKDVKLIDEYKGKGIEEGARSLTFSIIFGSEKKTLTDNFIENLFKKILKLLEQQCNIKMR